MTDFGEAIGKAYAFEGAALELGKGVHEDAVVAAAGVRVPLRMLNRHGLIAGATGTGKTVTLQVSPSSSRRPACRWWCPT